MTNGETVTNMKGMMDFWCMAITYDPKLPADETQSLPLKEYLIKFLVMNGNKPLTLDLKTFTASSGLDYNNKEYVAHPSPEAVKTQSARLRYRSLTENEGKTSSEVELDSKTLQLKTFADVQALLLSDDEMVQESDDEEVFAAGEEMDEDIPPTDEEAQSLPPNTNKHESSHAYATDELNSDSSSLELKKYNNILPLTERQLVKYLKKAKYFTSMAWNVGPRLTKIEHTQALMQAYLSFLKSHTSKIKSMMIEIYQAFTEPPSHTEGEHVTMEDDTKKAKFDKAKEEPGRAFLISTVKPIIKPNHKVTLIESSSRPLTDPILEIPVPQQTALVDKIKKVAEEAKMFEITKTELIKVVQEEVEKIGLDPNTIVSAKAGQKFKKAKDAKH
nr:hypothetical protein [Tanacetum cinerariifolium]